MIDKDGTEFDTSLKSALICIALSKLLSSEGESFLAHWSIPFKSMWASPFPRLWLVCGSIYKYGFSLALLQEVYWVTACFIFVWWLDASGILEQVSFIIIIIVVVVVILHLPHCMRVMASVGEWVPSSLAGCVGVILSMPGVFLLASI